MSEREKRDVALRLVELVFEGKLQGPLVPPVFTISSPEDEAKAEEEFRRLRAVSNQRVAAIFVYHTDYPVDIGR